MHPSEVFVVGVCDDVSHLRRGSGCAERRQNSGSGECGKLHICWQDEVLPLELDYRFVLVAQREWS